jgi:hypothetical protein
MRAFITAKPSGRIPSLQLYKLKCFLCALCVSAVNRYPKRSSSESGGEIRHQIYGRSSEVVSRIPISGGCCVISVKRIGNILETIAGSVDRWRGKMRINGKLPMFLCIITVSLAVGAFIGETAFAVEGTSNSSTSEISASTPPPQIEIRAASSKIPRRQG